MIPRMEDPKLATATDLFFSGLSIPKNTSNSVESVVTPINVDQIPRLNTLKKYLVRIDYAPNGGLNPHHTHPRGTEILVTNSMLDLLHPTQIILISKTIYPEDVFIFPIGLINFQQNVGKTKAVAFAGLSSQNPSVITIANVVFGSNPSINPNVLTRSFQLSNKVVKYL
ncbi:hypothetical protein REPUB_Repub06bG0068200 [Reevesia pubescens]